MEYSLIRMAKLAGFPVKGAYTIREVSEITGRSKSAINAAVRNGDLVAKLSRGASRGRRIEPVDFEPWWNGDNS